MTNTCKRFEECEAPICPLDKNFNMTVWYPGESFCDAKGYKREHWRIVQKRIAKLNRTVNIKGYFTVRFVEKITRVREGIKGLNPDL